VRVDLDLGLLSGFAKSNTCHGLVGHLITKYISIGDSIDERLVGHPDRDVRRVRRQIRRSG